MKRIKEWFKQRRRHNCFGKHYFDLIEVIPEWGYYCPICKTYRSEVLDLEGDDAIRYLKSCKRYTDNFREVVSLILDGRYYEARAKNIESGAKGGDAK